MALWALTMGNDSVINTTVGNVSVGNDSIGNDSVGNVSVGTPLLPVQCKVHQAYQAPSRARCRYTCTRTQWASCPCISHAWQGAITKGHASVKTHCQILTQTPAGVGCMHPVLCILCHSCVTWNISRHWL